VGGAAARHRHRARLTALAFALAALVFASAAPVHAATPRRLDLGFGDPLFVAADASVRDFWLGRASSTGAGLARIDVHWSQLAPKSPPPQFEPADPASPGYDWAWLDAAVRDAASHGLRVLLTVYSAPRWAEGGGSPASAYPGTWKPQPTAVGAFAHAISSRYSGRFPDPLVPGSYLPRVRYFEAWNEPNLDNYLSPQWNGSSSVGPDLYRELLNSFYAGVKQAQPRAIVIAGSLAPFGDQPGGTRTPPVAFLRRLLCLHGGRLTPTACPQPAHLDVLSDHPIAVGPPRQPATNPLDATTPDLGKLTRVLRRAEASGGVLPRARKSLWVTEFWYDSSPPDPDGVPLARQARWYEQDLYMFWSQGATAAIALQLSDSPPGKGFEFTGQAGIFFADGRPKPSRTALRFPLVARRLNPSHVMVWGIAPRAGLVQVQERQGGSWRTVGSIRADGPSRPFRAALAISGRARLRARLGREVSLSWNQR
jgi:hypothetical protein